MKRSHPARGRHRIGDHGSVPSFPKLLHDTSGYLMGLLFELPGIAEPLRYTVSYLTWFLH